MKSIIISYSLTGNNEALAGRTAKELSVDHIKVTEPGTRNTGSIILDLIFNRTPKVQPTPDKLGNSDFLILFGPVWIGQAATPLRTYFKHIKANRCAYAYISISGGADGPNSKLIDDLKKRTGKEPSALIDLHIADLLPAEPKPARKDTSAYRISDQDIKKLTDSVKKSIQELISF